MTRPLALLPFCLILLALFLLAPLALGGCTERAAEGSRAGVARVERGKLLVTIGGCNDCHTPMAFNPQLGIPVPQLDRLLSGHPQGAARPAAAPGPRDSAVIGPTFTSFRLPFGTVYAANLTPDPDTGLGMWTEEMFLRAMRTGRHMGGSGRPIMPPMPWPNLAQLSDEDLRSVWAYLRSVPAIRNDVPAPEVPDAVSAQLAAAYDKLLAGTRAASSR